MNFYSRTCKDIALSQRLRRCSILHHFVRYKTKSAKEEFQNVSHVIKVSKLSHLTTYQHLLKLFDGALKVKMIPQKGKRSKDAFIQFNSALKLQRAIDNWHMKSIDGSIISIDVVKPPKPPENEDKPQPTKIVVPSLTKGRTFRQIQVSRMEEADRSVLIRVKRKTDATTVKDLIRDKGLAVNNTFQEKNFLLVEFKDKASIERLFKLVGHFRGNEMSKIPVQVETRYLYKEPDHQTEADFEDLTDYPSEQNKFNISSLKETPTLSEAIMKCYDESKMTELDSRLRYFTASTLQEMLKYMFPHCKAHLFGSCVNGFGTRNGDIDIMFDLKQEKIDNEEQKPLKFLTNQRFNNDRHCKQQLLDIIGSMVWIFIPSSMQVNKILNARVPIVKFKHTATCMECDISLNDLSSIKMAELMFAWGEICPKLRPLTAVLKVWAHQRGIIKDQQPGPWLSNFMVIMMTVFYLQSKKLLPTFRQMHLEAEEKDNFFQDGVNYSFSSDVDKLKKYVVDQEAIDVGTLLKNFFDFYSDFDFEKHCISVIEGEPVEKTSFHALCIQNPLELGHNVSQNVNVRNVQKLFQEVLLGQKILQQESPTLYNMLSDQSIAKATNFEISSLFSNGVKVAVGDEIKTK